MEGKRVEIAVTYLFTYSFDELERRFGDLETDEEYGHAARIMLFGENMNDFEPNDIEIEVRRDWEEINMSIIKQINYINY